MRIHALILVLAVLATCAAATSPRDDGFTILVQDAESGEPIKGASIYTWHEFAVGLQPQTPSAPNARPEARTDERGIARLDWPFFDAAVLICSRHGDPTFVKVPDDVPDPWVIPVRRSRMLQGRVLEADGTPTDTCMRVTVSAWIASEEQPQAFTIFEAADPAWSNQRVLDLDSNGAFGPMKVPRADLLTIKVRDPLTGFEIGPVELPGDGDIEPVEFVLPKRALLRARSKVGEKEVGLEGGYWLFEPRRYVKTWGDGGPQEGRTHVSADAFTDVARLLPGRANLGFALGGSDDWSFVRVDLQPGGVHEVVLQEPALAPITGRLSRDGRRPLEHAHVRWTHEGEEGPVNYYGRVDDEGSYVVPGVFADLGPGVLRATALNGGGLELHSTATVEPGATVDLTVSRPPLGRLSVSVPRKGQGSCAIRVLRRGGQALTRYGWASSSVGQTPALEEHTYSERREAGEYYVVYEEATGLGWVAEERRVVVEVGKETVLDLEPKPAGRVVIQPAQGALGWIYVAIHRRGMPVGGITMNPVVDVPIVLAPGPAEFRWEWPKGTTQSKVVVVRAGERVALSLAGG